ncbi:MAG: IS1380 family transposase [Chitinophagales bacterium]
MIKKIVTIKKAINPFGGLNLVVDDLFKRRIPQLIDAHLGSRPKQAKYSYSDIILSWIFSNLCGAERLEDVKRLKRDLDTIPEIEMPSPDRIGGVFKSLATPTVVFDKGKKVHEFNDHKQLNDLLLDLSIKLNLIKSDVLDYDNTIINTRKYDTRLTYKYTKGYQPGISFIKGIPVHIQNRNGNSNASYKIRSTVCSAIDLLESKGISVRKFRSDSAAYNIALFDELDDRGIKFYVRMGSYKDMKKKMLWGPKWSSGYIGDKKADTAEIIHMPRGAKNEYRVIAKRQPTPDEGHAYYCIITNDWDMEQCDLIHFFNQRGKEERNFDALKNDFNWRRLPFSFLNENTVFLIISAMAYCLFKYLIRKYGKKLGFIKQKHRLKNFIFYFISIVCVRIGEKLILYTDQSGFEELLE